MTAVQTVGLKLIDFLMDLDRVLATDEGFILGKWIADAVRWADGNETYAEYLEYNARNQVRSLVPYSPTSPLYPVHVSLDDSGFKIISLRSILVLTIDYSLGSKRTNQ